MAKITTKFDDLLKKDPKALLEMLKLTVNENRTLEERNKFLTKQSVKLLFKSIKDKDMLLKVAKDYKEADILSEYDGTFNKKKRLKETAEAMAQAIRNVCETNTIGIVIENDKILQAVDKT